MQRAMPWILSLCLMALSGCTAQADAGNVTLLRTPDGGIQPQAEVDAKGVLHLIYYKGEPMAGDIFYVRRAAGEATFTEPVRVNSHPGSAIAMGTIRGAQLAIGQNGRVHVAWNGSNKAPKGPGGNPMLYARLNDAGTAFEPQRNLITWAGGIDGGGTLAAAAEGRVYVFWHAMADAKDEAGRAVFMARSTDEGKTFAREVQANPQPTGACNCCGMKAFIDSKGVLYVFYRSASENVNRDTILLVSRDNGTKFESSTLARWKLDACPMTTYAWTQGAPSAPVVGAWKNKEQIYFAALTSGASKPAPPLSPPGVGDNRKYPVVTANADGAVLLSWTEGTAWGKGGSLHWQLYDKTGQPLEKKGQADGVPTWSLVTAVPQADGSFVLIY